MPSPSSSFTPPLPAERTIARSRSRYKGPRPHKALTKLLDPPSFSAEQAQTSDAFVQDQATFRRAKNRTEFREELDLPQILHSYQHQSPNRRCDAPVEPHINVGREATLSQKGATSPNQYSRNPGPDLGCPNSQKGGATIDSIALPRRGLTQRVVGNSNGKRLRKGREELKRTVSAPIAIEQPRIVPTPAFDAPVSAVNAGERRVKVKYDQNLLSLPVTPSTTPREIIHSAADQLAEFIDPNSAALFESFKQLGLERPLRNYEHVRDVLNSWNHDTQNTLVIKPSSTGGRDDWLNVHSASTSQPMDISAYIHYSQRPGRWDKRWVTLRSDGQMLVAKKEGGETANICHMSDFDIYVPTAWQSAKRIRPPRKICFAVKSQQKSSMFLSTANFVHFFSTSDKTLAGTWYRAVLEWRSWYLVHVMGEGQQGLQGLERASTKEVTQEISHTGSIKSESQHRTSQSMNTIRASTSATYDTEDLAPPTDFNLGHNVAREFSHDIPFRSRSAIGSSQVTSIKGKNDLRAPRDYGPSFGQVTQPEEPKPEPFAPTGLLGRTYTRRQKAQREREKSPTSGPDQPTTTWNVETFKSQDQTLSQRPRPKPLIDLTPQYQEPPQHTRKGKGVILKKIPAGGLVEVANTPEAAISIPPSTTWRKPTNMGGNGANVGRSNIVQREHSSGAPSERKQTLTSSESGNMAFTGGLLASNSKDQGTGKQVMTRSRQAKEPMLDVGEDRRYAPGSLLEHFERHGVSHSVGEKEKKRENSAAVGKGI